MEKVVAFFIILVGVFAWSILKALLSGARVGETPEYSDAMRLLGRPLILGDLSGRKAAAQELLRRAMQAAREPVADPDDAEMEIGRTENSGTVVLSPKLRNRHVYVIGKTRTGKTTLLTNMIKLDISSGHNLCFIDPHGDAAYDLLCWIGKWRRADVLYFDPTLETAPAFNPFRLRYAPPKLTEDILSVFKMFFEDSWGPRMEHILRYAILALLADTEPHCLADLRRLLGNERYRLAVAGRLTHQGLKEFWAEEFPHVPSNATQPILNKLSAFLAPMSDLERVFSEVHNDIDFTDVLNGKLLIVNLAKGKIGEEPSRLLGGLFAACIQQAALARANVPEAERTDFYLYVDEFQNYTVSSFESILAESAKYRVNLTLANQNLGQIPTSLRQAIFGNVATLIAFQVSADDAPHLAREMCRPRIQVREKDSAQWLPYDEFLAKHSDLAPRYPEAQVTLAKGDLNDWQRAQWQSWVTQFETITAAPPSVSALRQAFNSIEFQEITFPEAGDFVNLPAYQAYIRRERAENVVRFESHKPLMTVYDEEKRRVLLELFAEQAAERKRATEIAAVYAAEAVPAEDSSVANALYEENKPGIVEEISEKPAPSPAREETVPTPRHPRQRQPMLLGKGGAQHRYLQDFIKRSAESKGYRAVIEEPALDGTGSIDVALFKGERKIACEISVTSSAEQEQANVTKCRAAGYEEVFVIAPEAKDLRKLQPIAEAEGVQVLRPAEFIEFLEASTPPELVRERVVAGYKVTTRWQPVEGADAEARRKVISQILTQGLRRVKEIETERQ